MRFQSKSTIHGSPKLPGDKSISHRCLIMASLAQGKSTFKNLSQAEDVLSTQKLLMDLGVEIISSGQDVQVFSNGTYLNPKKTLDCGNAGTLMRLMMGVLCGKKISATLVGDESLSARPMKRVSEPLLKMGAALKLENNEFSPVQIEPSELTATSYELQVPSAQVKSAILFAALNAVGETRLTGKIQSRDHTERLLKLFGVDLKVSNEEILISGNQSLKPIHYTVPKDISAASFWIAATLLSKSGESLLREVGVNPTRTGFVDVLKSAGADIKIDVTIDSPEPMADIRAKNSRLSGFHIRSHQIATLVDEVPLLALIATQCEGDTIIEGVEELRYKETDRVQATVEAIEALGGVVEVRGKDLYIRGRQTLRGGRVNSYGDHRIAMMAAVARYCVTSSVEVSNIDCVRISDPYFIQNMHELEMQ